jgi:single-stranded DNA-binding protein
VNKIFISGSVGANPQVSYTPKGQKIVMFPMWVEEGGFSIDVVFAGGTASSDVAAGIGKRVLVTGAVTKMKSQSRDVLRVKASKILPMEE